jgi:hypothetical protein
MYCFFVKSQIQLRFNSRYYFLSTKEHIYAYFQIKHMLFSGQKFVIELNKEMIIYFFVYKMYFFSIKKSKDLLKF